MQNEFRSKPVHVTKTFLPDTAEYVSILTGALKKGWITNHGDLERALTEKLKAYFNVPCLFSWLSGPAMYAAERLLPPRLPMWPRPQPLYGKELSPYSRISRRIRSCPRRKAWRPALRKRPGPFCAFMCSVFPHRLRNCRNLPTVTAFRFFLMPRMHLA